jgi:hypothetical protein
MPRKPAKSTRVRLYRFLNLDSDKYLEPFAMCDRHKETYRVPDHVLMDKIADRAVLECRLSARGV